MYLNVNHTVGCWKGTSIHFVKVLILVMEAFSQHSTV